MRKSGVPRKKFHFFPARALILGLLILFSRDIQAQIRPDAPYVLPHTIFVGDRGRFVVPLGPSFSEMAPFILEGPSELPQTPDLLIRRIELDRRGTSSRLLIDFVPYATGTLYLPPLGFLFPEDEAEALPFLSVHVTSILSPANMALSEPAPPLAVPGTSLLVYGTGILLLVLLSAGIAFTVLGPRYFRDFWERLRRRYRLRIMMRFLRRLKQECSLNKSANPGHHLTILSAKLREFLSFFTGYNCQSLTAMEFLELPLSGTALDPWRLRNLFRAWDTLRFSGQGMEMTDLFKAIDDVNILMTILDKAEKERSVQKPLTAPVVLTGGNL
jgi:hypothetical protein